MPAFVPYRSPSRSMPAYKGRCAADWRRVQSFEALHQYLKAVKIGLVQGVAHQAQHRDVDHHAVDLNRAQALGLGLAVGGFHLAGALDIRLAGREDLERGRDLRRMDRPFADHAERFGAPRLAAEAVSVA